MGPCPADRGGGAPGGPGDRRRSGDRPAQSAGGARDRLHRAESRRCAAAAPGGDGEGLHRVPAPDDRSLPRRGRPEVRRRPGPDTARHHPGAVDRHRRAAGAIRARDRDPDRQAAGGVQPAAAASGPPAARHSRRSALTASRAAPGHRRCRAPGGGSQRADRHRARRVLSDRDAERVGRIRGLDVRQLAQRLEPPVGGGRVDHADDLRRRTAAGDVGRDDRRSTTRPWPAIARRH